MLLLFAAFAWRIGTQTVRFANRDFLAFSDFFAQWSFALFAQTGDAPRIYEAALLHRFQLTLEPALTQTFPFPYPPSYLFAIWSLGWFGYGMAYLLWDAATLTLFIWAVFGTRWRDPMLLFVLLAPATALTLAQGQNGLLTGALIVGGTRLMTRRPILGGVLLGCATIKPQLGLLVPFALLGAGYWRTLAAASATAVVLALAVGLVFGWAIWPAWLTAAAGHAAYLDDSVSNYLKPGIMANLLLFGVPRDTAHTTQACLAVAVAGTVVACFRRGTSGPALAALQAGTFLAMPYVFRYDLPVLANAAILLIRDRERSGRPMPLTDAGIIALAMLAPALNTLTTRFFYVSGLSLLLLFGLAAWRALAPISPESAAAAR